MISAQQAQLLVSYLTLLENDAFLCGEAAGTDKWEGAYLRLKSDQATVTSYIYSLVQNESLN